MGRADYLRLGDFNAICYQCGFKRKASMMEKNWQGYYVCPEHNEPRQTQDFVRAIPDNQTVPWAQPVPPVVFTYTMVELGVFNEISNQFQFGSGLGGDAVTYVITNVYLNGSPLGIIYWHYDVNGLVTVLRGDPGDIITATGTETLTPNPLLS